MKWHLVSRLMVAGTTSLVLVASAMAQDAVYPTPSDMPFETGQSTTAVTTTTTTTTTTSSYGADHPSTPAGMPVDSTSYDEPPLTPVTVGNVTYLTGGIGEEERNQIQMSKKDYNLYIMSSSKDGAFTGATQLSITDIHGANVLTVADAGPLFLAKLPPGTYTINAAAQGETKKQKITVGSKGAATINFNW